MKKILIIGGTRFIGRTLIERLIALGKYDLTLFNRGKTNPHLFPEVKKIIGDRRTDDVQKISQQYWDIIIDVSNYFPDTLHSLLDSLEGKVGRYIYVSTGSLYQLDEQVTEPMNEEFPTQLLPAGEIPDNYNQRKAACEQIILSKKWLDCIIFRLGLVIGKHDYTDRLYYWFHKVQSQDAFLIPNEGKNAISYSDVDDLAKILIHAIDVQNNHKIYNANSYHASFHDFLSIAMKQLNRQCELVNINPEQFKKHELAEWTDLPLWVNGDYFRFNNSRLKEDFPISFNSVQDTTIKLLDYYSNGLKWREPQMTSPGLSIEKENDIIQLLKSA